MKARRLLDDAGLHQVQIFASGSLDEHAIAEILAKGAPISADAPDLDIAYKLCEYAGRGRLKLSTGKPVLPGRKQVFREEQDGRAVRDVIARAEEDLPGRPLLRPVMRDGRRCADRQPDLEQARSHAATGISQLPEHARSIRAADPAYPVEVSAALESYQDEITQELASCAPPPRGPPRRS